mmetsp:Transcript_1498/g.3347  ORF Transcript_1498/g.3347 Transcript_1498/m.3347 type:complete len:529 (+) Transcript_1498:630-2216(+)
MNGHHLLRDDSGVPADDGVVDLLVHGPDLVPLLEGGVPARALQQDELPQRLDGHAAPQQALHGGEARVRPAAHLTGVHKPLQLPLAHHRVHEVEPRKLPDVHVGQLRHHLLLQLEDPLELRVPVMVLIRPQRMRDSLKAVHKGASKVVGRVDLVGGAGPVVRGEVAAKAHGVPQGLVGVLHVELHTHAVLLALLRGLLHLLEKPQVLLHGAVPPRRLDAVHALFTHLLLGRVVRIKMAQLDHTLCELEHGREVVRGVGGLVWEDFQALEVVHDVLDELVLLLGRVGVVEAQEHLPFVVLSKVLVEEASLGVADVEVARRLWGEARDDLALLGADEVDVEAPALALLALALAAGLLLWLDGAELRQGGHGVVPLDEGAEGLVLLQLLLPQRHGRERAPDREVRESEGVADEKGAGGQEGVEVLEERGERLAGLHDAAPVDPLVDLGGGDGVVLPEELGALASRARGPPERRRRPFEPHAARGELWGLVGLHVLPRLLLKRGAETAQLRASQHAIRREDRVVLDTRHRSN